jgi:hypothetical protein
MCQIVVFTVFVTALNWSNSLVSRHAYHVKLSEEAVAAMGALMARTGMTWSQTMNYALVNTAHGHDGYYAQMAAFQSAIAAAAAMKVGQMMQRTPEDVIAFSDFVVFLANKIHGPIPEAPAHLKHRAAHEPIAKAFFDALASYYGPSK